MNQRSPWIHRLAIVPIPLMVLAMVALWVADLRVVWALPSLNWLVHYGPVALGIAFIVIPAARSFLANGQPSVLMLGCGMLMMDIGVTAMPIAFGTVPTRPLRSTIRRPCSGRCHFAGVAITSRRRSVCGIPPRG